MLKGQSIAFTPKAVVDQNHIRKTTNEKKIDFWTRCWRNLLLLNASIYAYLTLGRIWVRCRFEKFRVPSEYKKSFESMVTFYFQRMGPDCRIEGFNTTATQKKIDCLIADWPCGLCNTVFEAMGCFNGYCQGQKARPARTDENIQHESKNKETDEMQKQYSEAKCDTMVNLWQCESCKLYNTEVSVMEHLR